MSADGTSGTQRGVAVVVALAIHALLVLALVWRPAPEPRETDDTAASRPAASPEETRAESPESVPSPASSTRDGSARESRETTVDPTTRARDWIARRDDAEHRARVRGLGEQVATIMREPLERAWPELAARAAEGDEKATLALVIKATDCEIAGPVADVPPRPADFDPTAGFPLASPDERRWLRIAMAEDRAKQVEEAQACKALGIGHEALKNVVREQGIDDPLARWMLEFSPEQAAAPPPDMLDAGELMAELAATLMTTSTDERVRAESVAYLRERAPDSIAAAGVIATCHITERCGLRRDDPDARAAIERSAGWGNTNAIDYIANAARAANDPVEAWAWRAYDVALTQRACVGHPLIRLAPDELLSAQHALANVGQSMTPEQLRRARDRLAELDAQYGARTRAALGCGP